MSQLTAQQLPPTCVVVRQVEWTFELQLHYRRELLHQHWCKTFRELVGHVTWYEFQFLARKKELPTYLQQGLRYERLSYEQALLLHQAT